QGAFLEDGWAAGRAAAWVVGAGGTLLRWDGARFSSVTGAPPGVLLRAVWGSGPQDVWAVGQGALLHYDGAAWARLPPATDAARRLSEAGAQVAAGDVNEAALGELPPSIHRRRLDVSSEADCAAFVVWAHEGMGGLNGLINNAGILRDALLVKKDRTTGAVTRL